MSRTSRTFLALALLLCGTTIALAMPPHPALLQRLRDGTIDPCYALTHRQELLASGVDAPHENLFHISRPTDETFFRILVLCVDFADQPAITNASFYDTLFFDTGAGIRSVRSFYDEASYCQFHVVTQNLPSSIGWLRMPQNYSYYVGNHNL